jgi:hypothetical protein
VKFLREPLVQFLFLGGLIYLAYALFSPQVEEENERSIVVNASKVQWMQNSWKQRWNRLPTKEELDGLIQQYIKEAVLYREAINMGLDKGDGVIRRRLSQKVEFLAKDLVIYTPPTEEDLKKYYEEHQDKYKPDVTYTFTQIYFDPDKRGENTLDDAKKVKEKLVAQGSMLQKIEGLGDDYMTANYFVANTPMEIRKNFGSGFAQSLMKLKEGQWHGPVLSGFGTHLVFVNEIVSPPVPPLDEIKARVLEDWISDKREELNDEFYKALKAEYNIVIEDGNVSVLDVKK